jgi:hypothetical protein
MAMSVRSEADAKVWTRVISSIMDMFESIPNLATMGWDEALQMEKNLRAFHALMSAPVLERYIPYDWKGIYHMIGKVYTI